MKSWSAGLGTELSWRPSGSAPVAGVSAPALYPPETLCLLPAAAAQATKVECCLDVCDRILPAEGCSPSGSRAVWPALCPHTEVTFAVVGSPPVESRWPLVSRCSPLKADLLPPLGRTDSLTRPGSLVQGASSWRPVPLPTREPVPMATRVWGLAAGGRAN